MLKRCRRLGAAVILMTVGSAHLSHAQEQLTLTIVNQGKPPAVSVEISAYINGAKQPLTRTDASSGTVSFDLNVLNLGKGTRVDVYVRREDGKAEVILAPEGEDDPCMEEEAREGARGDCKKIGAFIWEGGQVIVDIGTGMVDLAVVSSGVVVATRTVQEGNRTLLLDIPATFAGTTTEDLLVELPKGVAEASVTKMPAGWTSVQDGRDLRLSGPPLERPRGYARVEIGRVDAPEKVKVKLFSTGEKIFDERIEVVQLPPFKVATALDFILSLPSQVSPGETIEFSPLDLGRTPADGTWTLAGVDANKAAGLVGVTAAPRYVVELPRTLGLGSAMAVTYTGPWGVQSVDVAAAKNVRVISLPLEFSPVPFITDCTPRIFVDQVMCVCGWFPTEESRNGILLSGNPLGRPIAASNRTVMIRIPSQTAPGQQQISGDRAAGYSEADQAEFVVLGVGGEIDQEKLWLGEATSLRLWVIGTEEVLPLRLTNTTPQIVSVDGGADQVVTTSGGPSNEVKRMVQGIQVGDFVIKYRLDTDPCPCAGEQTFGR